MGVNYSPKIVTNSLVFHVDAKDKRCYSGSGSICRDLSGINGNGTLTNISYTSDQAFSMNATNNSTITFSRNYTNVTNKHTFIIAAFCPNIPNGNFCCLMSSVNFNTLAGWNLNFSNTAGNPISSFFAEDGIISSVDINTSISLNRNYIIAGVIDGNIFRCYINGRLIGTQTVAMNINSDTLIELGYNTQAPYFTSVNAKIYKALIYNRPLSDQELLQNFNAIKGRLNL